MNHISETFAARFGSGFGESITIKRAPLDPNRYPTTRGEMFSITGEGSDTLGILWNLSPANDCERFRLFINGERLCPCDLETLTGDTWVVGSDVSLLAEKLDDLFGFGWSLASAMSDHLAAGAVR
jgi:hypothetical protein